MNWTAAGHLPFAFAPCGAAAPARRATDGARAVARNGSGHARGIARGAATHLFLRKRPRNPMAPADAVAPGILSHILARPVLRRRRWISHPWKCPNIHGLLQRRDADPYNPAPQRLQEYDTPLFR